MPMDHVESALRSGAKRMRPRPPGVPQVSEGSEMISRAQKAAFHFLLDHIEKKYTVVIGEINERDEVSFIIRIPAKCRKEAEKSFVIGRYTHEHEMRNFARCLNRGRLSRKNIDETIREMQALQTFCR